MNGAIGTKIAGHVSARTTPQSIKEAPAYDPTALEARAQLLRLHEHDGHANAELTWIGADQIFESTNSSAMTTPTPTRKTH